MNEASIHVGGIRSPLLEAGSPETAEAVVFGHGNPGSTADWTRLVGRTIVRFLHRQLAAG
jgi:pimeloyl-ACP methyl ester carboxylesterase